MTIFILFISMIINIVSIFAIIILYVRQNRLLNVEQEQNKVMKEMEEMFSSYLIEMKDENEEFIKKVQNIQLIQNIVETNVENSDHNIDQDNFQNETKIVPPIVTSFMRNHAEKTYQTAITKKSPINDEPTTDVFSSLPLEKQAILLEKEGLSIEQIARKLEKGKTEIELLLKFQQKK